MKKKNIVISILYLLAGFLIMSLYHNINIEASYLTLNELYAKSIEIENLKKENSILKTRKSELNSQIDTYSIALLDTRLSYEDLINSEINEAKAIAGLTKLEGTGVIIFVSDSGNQLQPNENPNNLLIHDLDISGILDDLRNAGAEAISVNGQRIIFGKSKIICTGPTILIDGVAFAPPFIIKAIGDRQILEASVNAPSSFTDSLRRWGVGVEVNTAIFVDIPAYITEEL